MNDYKEEYDEQNNKEEKGYSPFDSPSLSPSIISQPTNAHTPYRKTATLLIENSKLQLIGMSVEEKRWLFNSYKWHVKRYCKYNFEYTQTTLDFLLTLSTLDDLLDAIKSGVYMTYLNIPYSGGRPINVWNWIKEIFSIRSYPPATKNQIHYVGFHYIDITDITDLPRICPNNEPRKETECSLNDPSTLNFPSFNPDYILGQIYYEFSPPHEHYISSSGKEFEKAKSMDKSSGGEQFLRHEFLRKVAKRKPYAYFYTTVFDDKGNSEFRMYYWN